MRIEKASRIGLCYGVTRAISMLEKVAAERGQIETLGALAHNQRVLERLAAKGIRAARDTGDIRGGTIAISSHGVSPQVEAELRALNLDIIDTTCPFVHRAQLAARRLAEAGFKVIIFGDANHTEVKGILGWADGKGIAALSEDSLAGLNLPRHIGVLSQTTQIPANFTDFIKRLIERVLVKDAELRIVDTICHDTRERQEAALALAKRADLMLVIGSRTSANTNRLAELCSKTTETHLAESPADIRAEWLRGKRSVGISAGASTPEEVIDEVVSRLETLA